MANTVDGILLRGTHAARPAANAVTTGSLYSCTDHSLIYESDGASWATYFDPAGTAGAIDSTIVDAKGDLISATAADTPARLAVGTDGYLLSAASGQSTGLAWQVPGSTISTALTGDISPAQITANQNDYNPTGLSTATVLRLSTDASRNITGLQGGSDGRLILVANVGAQDIVLVDESASSSAANRFALNGDITLSADHGAALLYDSTSSRWRCVGRYTAAGGGSGDVATDAIWDAKGDLAVGTGANTASRLAVGTNGHVLTADSAEATGVKWASASGSGFTHSYLGYNTVGGSTETPTARRVYLKKVTVSTAGILTAVEAYMHSNGAAAQVSSLPAFGIWTDNSGTPNKLLRWSQGAQVSDLFYAGNDGNPDSTDGRWFGAAMGIYVTATDYWIGFTAGTDVGSLLIYYDGSGSDQYFALGNGAGDWGSDADLYARTTTTNRYSIRASIIT